ncbi:pseudouridylate synthase 7 -like protein [Brachionus plicatilis]|uniref:Pseudouridylate synthase 7-like protein n=1 Tax=Brachionus plicatilis TaxID=10195 RepID=A0A3M7RY33_BRAPC|nr:pseudouridylate synthase 7 -like protein [Brachionus plicatilis]
MSRKLDEISESNSKKLKINESEDEDFEQSDADEPPLVPSESRFGIRERTNKQNQLFKAILKQSHCDFIVNEVDLEGNVVRLTNFDIPIVEDLPKQSVEQLETTKKDVKRILGEELVEKLEKFLSSNSTTESMVFDAPREKCDRKLVHEFIKQNTDQYVTNTIQKDKENQLIEISHIKNNKGPSRNSFKANSRSKDLGDKNFTICSMYKENIDTIQAVNLICKHLRLNVKRVGYSGTKDKKAKTTQSLSFFKISPKEIDRLNKNFHNIKLGNFRITNDGLKLGDLSGNRFKIVLREVSEKNDAIIVQSLESLKANGFINYFGLQRFGNSIEVPTHIIGKQEVVDLILKPRMQNFEKDEIKKAREVWSSTNDANRALFHIQNINCIEKFLLNGLSKSSSNDYLGAFQHIPRNMRLMYLHAYQSFIWNEATSKRVELFGLKPAIGDLVRSESNQVIHLTENNLECYSIEDVILPLPGHNILYPQNEIKDFYVEVLKSDGLTLESFKNKIKDFSLSGDYRNILVKPKNMEYEIVNYSEKNANLVKSDWDLIDPSRQEDLHATSDCTERMKAICLEYSLPTSSYATMALREILTD